MTEALDPEPLLGALHEAGVDYVAIGGLAVQAHGLIRPTKDLDIVPDPDPQNLERLAGLLRELEAEHADSRDFRPEEFPFDPTRPDDLAEGANFRLETRLGSLDLLQWVAGIESDPAYPELDSEAIEGDIGSAKFRVCSLRHLIAMKRAAGRDQDLADLRVLEPLLDDT